MIKSLKISNIQSHKDSTLDFSKGVNVIVGASNQGKSAILRALYWVRYNRPLGIDTLASHWVVNEKGNLTKPMSVVLTNDRGVVERRRAKDENQYIVDGDELNVVKTDVPSQVENILKLSDTNVQKQLDAPFLLSQTSGEVAKYFNNMVNLDIIDKVLTNAESKRRKTKHDIEATKERIEELESSIHEYDWIDEVEPLLNEYMELSEKYDELDSKVAYIDGTLIAYEDSCGWLDFLSMDESTKLLKKYESISDSIGELDESIKYLEDSVDFYESNDNTLYSDAIKNKSDILELGELRDRDDDLFAKVSQIKMGLISMGDLVFHDVENAKKYVHKLEVLMDSDIDEEIDSIERDISNCNKYEKIVKERNEEIDRLNKSMPKICPICGSPLKENCCL